ncbi:MAG TPA: PDZ domain-containing protein [Thermodesulfobacteriota bacterium]
MGYGKTLFAGFIAACSILFAPPSYGQLEHPAAEQAEPQSQSQDRPWLGITIQEMNEAAARSLGISETKGVFVSQVAPGGPAQEAGLQMGDVIVELNGEDVRSADDFISRIRTSEVGSTVALEVNRGGATENINVRLGEMPSAAMMSKSMTGGNGGMMGGMSGGMMGGMSGGSCPDCPMCGNMGQTPCPQTPCPMMGQMMGQAGGQCPQMDGKKGMRRHGDGKGMMMGPGMSGGMMGHMYGKLMRAVKGLDLTAEQKAKARDIHTNFRKQAIKTGAEIKIARIELHELLKAEPVNMEKVKAKAGEIASKSADLMLSGIRSMEEFKKVLTPQQRGKLNDMLAFDSGADDMDAGEDEMSRDGM